MFVISKGTNAMSQLVGVEALHKHFGADPHPEVPINVFEAQICARPNEPVWINFHCIASRELLALVAPSLLAYVEKNPGE